MKKERIKCAYTELISPDKLIGNPRNNNKHNVEQINWLSKIIDFQGQRRPVIISKRSGFVNCGHATIEAIKKHGLEKIAVDYQDFESEAEEYAHMTSDNEIARYAELDLSQVHLDLEEINFDLDTTLLGINLLSKDELDKEDIDEEKEQKYILEVELAGQTEKDILLNDLLVKGYIVRSR
jgi:hypothetical protein